MFGSSNNKKQHRKHKKGSSKHSQLPSVHEDGADHHGGNAADEHRQAQSQQELHVRTGNYDAEEHSNTLIYAAPTVDTLGTDEGSLLRLYRQTPRLQMLGDSASVNGDDGLLARLAQQGILADAAMTLETTTTDSSKLPHATKNKIQQTLQDSRQQQHADREFQFQEDLMTVTVRQVPVSERSAFDKKLPQYGLHLGGGDNHTSNKKVSPSWQHWQVLQRLSSQTHIRQLAFSPSVGPGADVFWNEAEDDEESSSQRDDAIHGEGNKRRRNPRDGRYRSINPVRATMEGLPKTPPLLSNKKHRLPLRSDVGFPNASPEEIQRKQTEIHQETEWEEASPRLIVLVTSDDLGTAVQQQGVSPDHENGDATTTTSSRPRGLPGMPWAGRDLIEAKQRNNRHFSRRRDTGTTSSVQKVSREASKYANMLAPPLDAIPSRTLGWRPRPFHDRPPGLNYTLVCPLAVNFAIGKMEPLICSLTLYSMQNGKASEHFYFPAGDWRGKLRLDSLQAPDDYKDLAARIWEQRKHKAIFAHNSPVTGGDDDDLYVVLQVYKVAHADAMRAYWAKGNANNAGLASFNSPPSMSSVDKKTWRKRLKNSFQKDKKKTNLSAVDESDIERAHLRSNAVFEAYGTQLTTPLCFGVTRLFPEGSSSKSRSNCWPKGQVQQGMNMYAFPSCSESESEFLHRLRCVAGHPMSAAASASLNSLPATSTSWDEDTSVNSESVASFTSPPMKMSSVRKFMTPNRKSKRNLGSPDPKSKTGVPFEPTLMVPGSVSLFTSSLDIDFLQSMLTTPPELIDQASIRVSRERSKSDDDAIPKEVSLPRILVDASADSAIMINPARNLSGASTPNPARRSDLVRLPSKSSAEYLDTSEFREILFLPPRTERGYECDYLQANHRSLLNLLYLYPRRLVLKPKDGNGFIDGTGPKERRFEQDQRYTIRIRLVQNLSSTNTSGIVESSNKILANFHNPASWSGSNLVPGVFTRIPCDSIASFSSKEKSSDTPWTGVSLRDEYKMNLPTTLDGSYFLQFTLFAVDLFDHAGEISSSGDLDVNSCRSSTDEEDCGVRLRPLGEATIPLSSSSMRDPNSGAKATTVIPNGCHRLRLGDFHFHIETRLVSSIHVSDPAIAAALRDFPLAERMASHGGNQRERFDEMVLVTSRSVQSRPLSQVTGDASSSRISFSSLFASSSGSSIAGHFQPLLFLHLSNLIQPFPQDKENISDRFLQENLLSLAVLVQRVKAFFFSQPSSCRDAKFELFVKAVIDAFDEGIIYGTAHQADVEEDAISEAMDAPALTPSIGVPSPHNEEASDGGAIRRRKRNSVSAVFDDRISKTFSAMESAEIPFSRKAYGATKTERMKIEAEFETDETLYKTLFDDDETVLTLSTTVTKQAEAQLAAARSLIETQNTASFTEEMTPKELTPSSNSIEQSREQSHGLDFGAYQRSISDLALGQKVKSAAQVMLAPCVAPGLSAVFLCKTSPRNPTNGDNSEKEIEIRTSRSSKSENSPIAGKATNRIVHSGSELDDNDQKGAAFACTENGLCRGPWGNKLFEFSAPRALNSGRKLTVMRCAFLYESILLLWQHSWIDYVQQFGRPRAENIFSSDVLGDDSPPFISYYLHMDLFLPLVLKSMALRHGQLVQKSNDASVRVVLDSNHITILGSSMEMLAIGLMGHAAAEPKNLEENFTLLGALKNCDLVLDFLIGLFAVVHPAHMVLFVRNFIKTLRACETNFETSKNIIHFEWNVASLHRAKCSRQLRLRTIERLAVMNNFVAVNFPPRFGSTLQPPRSKCYTWTMQSGTDTSSDDNVHMTEKNLIPDDGFLPQRGWLASMLTSESLSICALSCEAVVAEAMAHIESQEVASKSEASKASLIQRPTAALNRDDLLMFQSIAIHGISVVHELLLRRHAMDKRFQKDSTRERIAAMFLQSIFDKSLASVRWLARMESTHKVRSIWLLCFVYILQEAPESLMREAIRLYCNPSDGRIHRFIRLLRLGSSTFQSFIDQERHCTFPSEIDKNVSPWLLQESFNTICATTILVVEESVNTSVDPNEQKKMIQGILDLLLHVLTTPQSSVTHLRAVGGAIQALEKFGAQMFLEITGPHLQHWIRIILGLMNSTALSVRSIAVDFVVSLLGGIFELAGNIDDVTLIFATVLPEVAAREIALCSVSGLVHSIVDAEKVLWPLRRSFADIEDANPLDDDRVDPQLPPVLSIFCRAAQAIMDGVIIEMRLQGDNCVVVGSKLQAKRRESYAFDADEESLFEAANFFVPETAPMQRLRWLATLKSLHEFKGQWVEAAETLVASARTISDAIPHLNDIWRPSRFPLWYDARRSLWLSTVGEEIGIPEQGNAQVMSFAGSFLEPGWLMPSNEKTGSISRLPQPSLQTMCSLLILVSREAVSMYSQEGCVDGLAYTRLESLLRVLMNVLDNHDKSTFTGTRMNRILFRKRYAEEEACLRKVTARITSDLTNIAAKLPLVDQDSNDQNSTNEKKSKTQPPPKQRLYYVRVRLSGNKPNRFQESTSLPSFLDWDSDSICRVPKDVVENALSSGCKTTEQLEIAMCTAFCKIIRDALLSDSDANLVVFRVGSKESRANETAKADASNVTTIDINFVQKSSPAWMDSSSNDDDLFCVESWKFHFHDARRTGDNLERTMVEMTVARAFPSPLSRQRSVFTTETSHQTES